MFRRLAIASSLFALSAFAQPIRPTPNAPLVAGVAVENQVYNAANHTVDYDMVNLSGKAASAWVIVQYARNTDGSESVSSWTTTEMAGSTGSNLLLPDAKPHSLANLKTASRTNEITNMRVTLAAVIYDDASAEGDDAFLNSLFAVRKARSDEQQRWIGRISALRSSANPGTDAQKLYQDMVEASYQEDKANVGEVTADQGQGRQERQALQETVRGLVQAAEAKRPLDPKISRMETHAELLLQSSVRKN